MFTSTPAILPIPIKENSPPITLVLPMFADWKNKGVLPSFTPASVI